VAKGRGRKPQPGLTQKIVETTVRSKPAGQIHGSTRTMAKGQVLSAAAAGVHRRKLAAAGATWNAHWILH